MSRFGRFLELSLPVADIGGSRDFYLRLGFTELPVNDVRAYPYTAVTDGRVVLGLHGGGRLEAPALTFVRPELARHVRSYEEQGAEFVFMQLGADAFNEALLVGPDGHAVLMIEARTFSPGTPGDAPAPLIGRSAEISLRCSDRSAAFAFWLDAGFAPRTDLVDEDSGAETLSAPGIVLGLRGDSPAPTPVLRFGSADPAGLRTLLEARGVRLAPAADGGMLTAPEGTRLWIVQSAAPP